MDVSTAPFVWLGASICSVWFEAKGPLLGRAWIGLLVIAIGDGLTTGLLQPIAVAGVLVVAGATSAAMRVTATRWATAARIAGLLVALALGLHLMPGFKPASYSLNGDGGHGPARLHFDSGVAGLLVLAVMCRRMLITKWSELGPTLRRAAPAAAFAIGAPIAAAFAIGVARPTFNAPEGTWRFLVANLVFTCVGEEAAFRGVIQCLAAERFGWDLTCLRGWVPVLLSTALFAAAHAAGGAIAVALVAVAGLGYGITYAATKRLEAAILVHLSLNAVVFLFLKLA